MCHSGNCTLHRLPQCPLLFPWFPLSVPASSPWLFIRSLQQNSGQRTEHGVQPGEQPTPCWATWPWTVPLLCVLESWIQHGDDGVCGDDSVCASRGCGSLTWQPYRPQKWWMACVSDLSILLQNMFNRYLNSKLPFAHSPVCISFLSSVGSQCRPTSLLFPQSKASEFPILGCQVAITQFVIQDFLSPPGACFILFSWAWPSLAHLFSRPVFFPASASLPPFLSCLPKSPFS